MATLLFRLVLIAFGTAGVIAVTSCVGGESGAIGPSEVMLSRENTTVVVRAAALRMAPLHQECSTNATEGNGGGEETETLSLSTQGLIVG